MWQISQKLQPIIAGVSMPKRSLKAVILDVLHPLIKRVHLLHPVWGGGGATSLQQFHERAPLQKKSCWDQTTSGFHAHTVCTEISSCRIKCFKDLIPTMHYVNFTVNFSCWINHASHHIHPPPPHTTQLPKDNWHYRYVRNPWPELIVAMHDIKGTLKMLLKSNYAVSQ